MNVRDQAERWLAADPDPDTRDDLRRLLDADDVPALAERFGARLEFGTAGIRGEMGPGPARMNRVVVRRTTAGLAAHLLAALPGAAEFGVVVGSDARHKSAEFAADTAGVLAAAGLAVHLFPEPVPTPLVAFAVRHLGAAAGVQVTASHNPGADNGYKVYWQGGAQIIPPLDSEISTAIDAVEGVPAPADLGSARIGAITDELFQAYRAAVLALVDPGPRHLAIVYTPLHGVALAVLRPLLAAAGFLDLTVVAQQADPDPDFPTAPFPNPEEAGALDLAIALARERNADLLLANDPDGDRIAVGIPQRDGSWRVLSGDEVGCVLAEDLLARTPGGSERLVATTVVSSQLLGRIAAAHGASYAETLTGFKWLAAAVADAEVQGRRPLLAYEQALGVMVGLTVRDKDGLSAALAVADLAARLKAAGRDLQDALDELSRRYGVHLTGGRNVRLDSAGGPEVVTRALAQLRGSQPRQLDGVAVTAVTDHGSGVRTAADGTVTRLMTPVTDLFGVALADGSRLQVRPSGTEPLLKFYAEVVEPVDPVGDEVVDSARRRAAVRLDRLTDAFLALAGLGAG